MHLKDSPTCFSFREIFLEEHSLLFKNLVRIADVSFDMSSSLRIQDSAHSK